MIAYWTGRLSAGFVPGLVQESLEKWSEKDLSADERLKVEALARLTADPLGRSRPLADAPGIPASALADNAGGRLFVGSASGEGLYCLELESGRKIWQLDPGQVRRPAGMALAGELLVVCDRWMNRVLAVSAADGSLCWTVENAGGERDKLTEPADVALVQKPDCRELWVADRSNHRICRYTTEGRHLGNFGRRGLAAEEIIWQNTAGPREPSPVFLEFPESIACVKDLDNLVSVFIWDSGNCRVLCFTVAGELKRVIALESGIPAGHRQAFRLRVLESPAGPLPVAMDEVDNALIIWTPQGDLVLRTVLSPALFGKSSLAETARLVADAGGHGFPPALVTSKPSIVSLRGEAFDLPALLQASAAVRPDQARWLLALWESGRGPENGKENLARLWSGPLARMGAEVFACSLLRPERIVDGGLSGNLERVESLTGKSAQAGFGQAASGLSRAVDSRLESLAADLEKNLLGLALPEAGDLEAWAEAQTALDLALFKNRGNNQLEALRRDSTLEPMRQLPDTTRRTAWAYRCLCRELTRREKDPLPRRQRPARLAGRAREFLDRRAGELLEMIRQIDFGCEPTQVRADELKAVHRGLLTVKSIDRVAGFLAAEICASLDGDSAVGQPAADLLACAGLAADRERWEELYAKASGDGPQAAGGDRPVKPETGLKKTEKLNPKKLLKKLRGLVERMEDYRKSLERTSAQGGVPNRVLARQKELFALKAALLLALLKMESFESRELTALAGKAQVLAGESWGEVAGDFVHRPAAGGPA